MAQNYSPEALEKRRAYSRQWHADNRAARKAYNADWYRSKNVAHHVYNRAKSRASKQGIPFAIARADVVVPETCPVCGVNIEASKGLRTDTSPSLDKVIPTLGYVPGNVAVICMRCNRRKSDLTLTDLDQLRVYITCASNNSSPAN